MSRARMSRAKTFSPVTFEVPSIRYFSAPSRLFQSGRVSNRSSNSDANAPLPSGARYTAIPPITLARSTCRRDGRNGIMVVPWVTDLRATLKSSEPAARIDRRAGCYAMPSPITMMTMVSRSVWRARFQHTRTISPSAGDANAEAVSRTISLVAAPAVNQCRKREAALALTPSNISYPWSPMSLMHGNGVSDDGARRFHQPGVFPRSRRRHRTTEGAGPGGRDPVPDRRQGLDHDHIRIRRPAS